MHRAVRPSRVAFVSECNRGRECCCIQALRSRKFANFDELLKIALDESFGLICVLGDHGC